MKNNKGITIISLVIIILIMIMLISITAYEANDLIAITRVQSVTTNLLLIQAKVRIINEQVVFESDEEESENLLKGTKLSLDDNAEILSKMKAKNIITDDDNIDNYYVLSQQDLIDMGLEDLNANDGYVVNYENEEVIYVTGVKNAEKKYLYKLQGEVLV